MKITKSFLKTIAKGTSKKPTTSVLRKIPMSQKKTSCGRTHQSNITFTTSSTKSKLTTSDKAMEANTSTDDNANAEKQSEGSGAAAAEGTGTNMTEILEAINNIKADFSSYFDGILTAIEHVRKEISDCSECVTQM